VVVVEPTDVMLDSKERENNTLKRKKVVACGRQDGLGFGGHFRGGAINFATGSMRRVIAKLVYHFQGYPTADVGLERQVYNV
jgi:hypothetical protein